MSKRQVRFRFWLEAGVGALSLLLLVLTLITREWIEAIIRVDPDGGSGAAEWGIVAGLAVIAVVSACTARVEWKRVTAQVLP